MKVVFHADDFGLMPAVNRAVIEAHHEGVLTSTSLMVTGGAAEEAAELARAHPSLDVGLHLTLVGERPALPLDQVPTLVDGQRFWGDHPTVAQRYLSGRWNVSEAVRELEAQWDRCAALGVTPSHCDGHQHLHLLPGVFEATVTQALRRGVRCVRTWLGDPLTTPGGLARRLVSLGMRGVSWWSWRRVPANDRRRLRDFITLGFVQAGGTMTVDALMGTLERLRVGRGAPEVVEVMLHPAHRDAEAVERYGHWHYEWENDLALLKDRRLRALLQERGFEVTSFKELAAAHG